MLDARKLLTQPFAYEGLKRALQARELRIESLGQAYSLVFLVEGIGIVAIGILVALLP